MYVAWKLVTFTMVNIYDGMKTNLGCYCVNFDQFVELDVIKFQNASSEYYKKCCHGALCIIET